MKAQPTANGLAIHFEESVYSVHSGASLHVMGPTSQNKKENKTIGQPNKILDIHTSNGIVVSDTQAKVYIWLLFGVHMVENSPSVLA